MARLLCMPPALTFLIGWSATCVADVVRVPVDRGATAALQDGRLLFLECRAPRGDSAAYFFERYLADPRQWVLYKNRNAVAIPFNQLKPEVQRHILLAVFREDYVDDQGWWHTVLYSGQGQETLWSLCEWTTGNGLTYKKILATQPHLQGPALEQNQRLLIPRDLLLDVMKAPTARAPLPPPPAVQSAPALPVSPTPSAESEDLMSSLSAPQSEVAEAAAYTGAAPSDEPIDLEAVTRELEYGQDERGPFAAYTLKQGEALYTAVVVRFTDYRDNSLIQQACETVQARSGIRNVRSMPPGQRVLIPLEMLADRFRPKGSEQREEYEKAIQEARRLRQDRVRSKDLEGVVVVVDAGHGGRDQGGASGKFKLYEDEINYDVACRVKRILETRTQARVYMTIVDLSQQYNPTDRRQFSHDTDEYLLTSPRYENREAKESANLRWCLANSYYRQELAKGTDPRKIIFTSFHTDALYNSTLRGAMIYIPGAKYCHDIEPPKGLSYAHYKEVREQPRVAYGLTDRRRDEALSRNFAEEVITAFGRRRVRRHLESDWIRSQIRQNGGVVYVPAVLRNTQIPTKILIEMANITNETDCARLADPEWRQTVAEAYVDALKNHFGS